MSLHCIIGQGRLCPFCKEQEVHIVKGTLPIFYYPGLIHFFDSYVCLDMFLILQIFNKYI